MRCALLCMYLSIIQGPYHDLAFMCCRLPPFHCAYALLAFCNVLPVYCLCFACILQMLCLHIAMPLESLSHQPDPHSLSCRYGHGQISNKAYYEILSACGADPIQTLLHGPLPPACNSQVQAAFASVGNFYGYGLYDDCNFEPNPWGPGPFQAQTALPLSRRSFRRSARPSFYKKTRAVTAATNGAGVPTIDIPGLEGYYCPGPALPIWINRTDVRKVRDASLILLFAKSIHNRLLMLTPLPTFSPATTASDSTTRSPSAACSAFLTWRWPRA